MATPCQLFIFTICYVIFQIISVLSTQIEHSSVSNLNALNFNYQIPSTVADGPLDLAESLYQDDNQRKQLHQPRVYQSTIDRTLAPSRLASTLQASTTTIGDLNTAAGHHHGHAHGKYYEYREVPKKKTWKFGYKRGNHKHHIERHEHGKAGKHPHFKTKVKWADKKSKGKGIHLWDYNHHDKKHHYHHGK